MTVDTGRVPVTVLGGYLGAGKTTALNSLLASASERLAVMVNDFGAVTIDADLIEGAAGDVVELRNGCICCSLSDGFVAGLETLSRFDPAPDRLMIEASGVSDLAQVASWAHLPGLRLDAVVCLVDAEKVRLDAGDRWVGDLVVGQIRAADIVVMNKVDLVEAGTVAGLRDWLGALSGGAPVVATSGGVLAAGVLDGRFERRLGGGAADGAVAPGLVSAGPAESVFVAHGFERSGSLPVSELVGLFEAMPASVVRAKALVCVEGEAVAAHRVGRRVEIDRVGAWWGGPGRLVVIEIAAVGSPAGESSSDVRAVTDVVAAFSGWAVSPDGNGSGRHVQ